MRSSNSKLRGMLENSASYWKRQATINYTFCIFGTSCCITSDFKRLKMNGPKMDFILPIKFLSSAFSSFFKSTSSVAKRSGIMNSNNDQSSCHDNISIQFSKMDTLNSNVSKITHKRSAVQNAITL